MPDRRFTFDVRGGEGSLGLASSPQGIGAAELVCQFRQKAAFFHRISRCCPCKEANHIARCARYGVCRPAQWRPANPVHIPPENPVTSSDRRHINADPPPCHCCLRLLFFTVFTMGMGQLPASTIKQQPNDLPNSPREQRLYACPRHLGQLTPSAPCTSSQPHCHRSQGKHRRHKAPAGQDDPLISWSHASTSSAANLNCPLGNLIHFGARPLARQSRKVDLLTFSSSQSSSTVKYSGVW